VEQIHQLLRRVPDQRQRGQLEGATPHLWQHVQQLHRVVELRVHVGRFVGAEPHVFRQLRMRRLDPALPRFGERAGDVDGDAPFVNFRHDSLGQRMADVGCADREERRRPAVEWLDQPLVQPSENPLERSMHQ
jgi:hypothetical protein